MHHRSIQSQPHRPWQSVIFLAPMRPESEPYYHVDNRSQTHYSYHIRYPIDKLYDVVGNLVDVYRYSQQIAHGTQITVHSTPSHDEQGNHSPLRCVLLDQKEHLDRSVMFLPTFYPHLLPSRQFYHYARQYHRLTGRHSVPCSK
ncbi:hypothetical protein D3C71_1678640 [compost metagenome]